ncbi:MAG: ATPase [Bacteroidales bacterium]|jgi:N-acetylglucosamine kinase-like BadF-type ATPase|nr:ATPase [Bacteroidales bacterium]
MILIAESGSTKVTWALIDAEGNTRICNTGGINPFFLSGEEIRRVLEEEMILPRNNISSVYFYGAGALPGKEGILSAVLSNFFKTESIEIHTDLLAAARSLCQRRRGIACILGTGSNSCFYDGNKIVSNVPPLGFILGDEGSGAYLGRKLLSDILKKQFSQPISDIFFANYPVTVEEILENTYRKPFPNRYLAQYTRFIARYIGQPEIYALVNRAFEEFFLRNVMKYEHVAEMLVHFTGSVAFIFRKNLEEVAGSLGVNIGSITQNPMDGLIRYHLEAAFRR